MQHLSLAFLTLLYILASVRYYPGQGAKTALETLIHMVSAAPFPLGCTIMIVIILQKKMGHKMPRDRAVRIFLGISLFIEFLLAVQDYVKPAVSG